jgi:hypothetical protein
MMAQKKYVFKVGKMIRLSKKMNLSWFFNELQFVWLDDSVVYINLIYEWMPLEVSAE